LTALLDGALTIRIIAIAHSDSILLFLLPLRSVLILQHSAV